MKRGELRYRSASRFRFGNSLNLAWSWPMNELSTKSSLSESEQWLVELMQTLNFGRIEALLVRAGRPVSNPAPQIIQKLKIGGENGPRPERAHDDFLLKRQTIEMLEALRKLGDGKVLAIEVQQ